MSCAEATRAQREVQPEAGVLVLEVGAEQVLDAAQAVVERLAAEVQRPRGLGLVAAVGAERLERRQQLVLARARRARASGPSRWPTNVVSASWPCSAASRRSRSGAAASCHGRAGHLAGGARRRRSRRADPRRPRPSRAPAGPATTIARRPAAEVALDRRVDRVGGDARRVGAGVAAVARLADRDEREHVALVDAGAEQRGQVAAGELAARVAPGQRGGALLGVAPRPGAGALGEQVDRERQQRRGRRPGSSGPRRGRRRRAAADRPRRARRGSRRARAAPSSCCWFVRSDWRAR